MGLRAKGARNSDGKSMRSTGSTLEYQVRVQSTHAALTNSGVHKTRTPAAGTTWAASRKFGLSTELFH